MESLFDQCHHGIYVEPVFIIEFLLNQCRRGISV